MSEDALGLGGVAERALAHGDVPRLDYTSERAEWITADDPVDLEAMR